MQRRISILGGGWIGLPLAKRCQASGHCVSVSTTSQEKAQEIESQGLQGYTLQLTPEPQGEGWEAFLEADILVISIPPKVAQQGAHFHAKQLARVIPLLSDSTKVLYTSSTGIFTDHAGEVVHESTVPKLISDRALAIGRAEHLMREMLPTRGTILRFGGLMGGSRIPGGMTQNKPLRNPKARVNFVHREDAIGLVMRIVEREAWGQTFHAVAPVAATRQAVYEAAAKQCGWPTPVLDTSDTSPGHIVESTHTLETLDYQYQYPDPRAFLYEPK